MAMTATLLSRPPVHNAVGLVLFAFTFWSFPATLLARPFSFRLPPVPDRLIHVSAGNPLSLGSNRHLALTAVGTAFFPKATFAATKVHDTRPSLQEISCARSLPR